MASWFAGLGERSKKFIVGLSVVCGISGITVLTIVQAAMKDDDKPVVSTEGKDASTVPTRDFIPCGISDSITSIKSGWGPERPFFELKRGAPYPTINSIPEHQPNEPDFASVTVVTGTPGDEGNTGYCKSLRVMDGDIVQVFVYIANSADDALWRNGRRGVATGVKVGVESPTSPSSLQRVTSNITCANCNPRTIFSSVELVSSTPFVLDYIPGSAQLYTNAAAKEPLVLRDSIWNGQPSPIGYRKLDGRVPPPYQYSAIAIVRARVTAHLP